MSYSLSKTVFILNLGSGRKKTNPLLEDLKKRELNYFISESAENFKLFIDSNLADYKTIVICGGDGTINNIINQTHNHSLTYAIYPGGSGNGLARELGYKKDLDRLLQSIEKQHTLTIDLIKINNQYCINMAGIGFDGYVAHQFDKSKKRGFKSYIKETIKALRKYKTIHAKITTDDKTREGKYFMINIANTRQFGNNAYIAPNAQFNDGLIELALIHKIPFYKIPLFFYRLFNLKLKDSKHIEYLQTKTVLIDTNATYYHIDGEPLQYSIPLKISIAKRVQFIIMT